MAQTATPEELKPRTLEAFGAYIHEAETEMGQTLHGSGPFLWSDSNPKRARHVRSGKVVAQFWAGRGPVKVPHGLIHDWVAAAFIPDTTVGDTLVRMQDYDNHTNIYKPEVIDSKLIGRRDNDFQIYLRLLKKKIITVVLDTEHEVRYRPLGRTRWVVAEVEDAGGHEERVSSPDTGYGFLWRLYSYWRLQERDDGVIVQCRAISLTRDVPFGLGWAIEPIIQKLPKESLISTLETTRQALRTRAR